MKIAFNQATTLKNSNLADDLRLCEKHGYDLIEIRLDKLRDYLQTHSAAELAAFFQQSRLKPYAFNALEFITFRDQDGYQQIKDDLLFLCRIGEAIGCKTVIAVPSFDCGDYTISAIREETVRVLRELAELAAPYGVRIALEFCGYPDCSVNTFGQAYAIVQEANREDVGLVLDCFHFHAMNSRLDELRQADPAKIFVLHLDDCEDLPVGALRDHHRVWPGAGAIALDDILGTLREIGYAEMASVELFRPAYWEWEAERTIKTAKETAAAVLGRHFAIR